MDENIRFAKELFENMKEKLYRNGLFHYSRTSDQDDNSVIGYYWSDDDFERTSYEDHSRPRYPLDPTQDLKDNALAVIASLALEEREFSQLLMQTLVRNFFKNHNNLPRQYVLVSLECYAWVILAAIATDNLGFAKGVARTGMLCLRTLGNDRYVDSYKRLYEYPYKKFDPCPYKAGYYGYSIGQSALAAFAFLKLGEKNSKYTEEMMDEIKLPLGKGGSYSPETGFYSSNPYHRSLSPNYYRADNALVALALYSFGYIEEAKLLARKIKENKDNHRIFTVASNSLEDKLYVAVALKGIEDVSDELEEIKKEYYNSKMGLLCFVGNKAKTLTNALAIIAYTGKSLMEIEKWAVKRKTEDSLPGEVNEIKDKELEILKGKLRKEKERLESVFQEAKEKIRQESVSSKDEMSSFYRRDRQRQWLPDIGWVPSVLRGAILDYVILAELTKKDLDKVNRYLKVLEVGGIDQVEEVFRDCLYLLRQE